MPFVVETGVGLSDANAALTVAEADTYHSDYGNSGWTGTQSEKELAIVKGTRAAELVYAGRWRGTPTVSTQSLAFPRTDVVNHDGIELATNVVPRGYKYCVAELALKARLGEDLLPDLSSPSIIRDSFVQVGPIKEALTLDQHEQFKRYTVADRWLVGLLKDTTKIRRG